MKIQILVDNPSSWIVPFAEDLAQILSKMGHETCLIHKHRDVKEGDILCLLSCERIFRRLNLNIHNLVVHESDLPKGKGWSPVTWQILEGKNKIPVTLFEAGEEVDSGIIYDQKYLKLKGTELLPEIKEKQGKLTQELIINFIMRYPNVNGRQQYGESTFYLKRTPLDSEIDINKTIKMQLNLLRICDNDRYPAFFKIGNRKFILKIFSDNSDNLY